MEHRMKIPIIPALMLVVLATLSAFGQASVVYSRTNYSVILPTNITAVRIGGQFITNPVGLNLTNRGGSVGVVDTLPTNTLPGLLSGLSVGNGGGLVTNLAYPVNYWFTNQNFTTNWTIPAGARSIFIRMVGHGGPGGSGRRYAAGTVASGGSGGGGGAYAEAVVGNVGLLWTNKLTIVLPAIRLGGAAVTTDDSDGTNGAGAGYTYVYVGPAATTNILVRAIGGFPGVGGDGTGSSGGLGGFVGSAVGTSGGASSGTGGAGAAGTTLNLGMAGSGGGAGGGITTGSAPSAGGTGAAGPVMLFSDTALAPAGAIASNGTNYNALWRIAVASSFQHGWPGAGGGGSSTNSVGGNGADGYGWGSGGGGGGASLNGFNSGKGGNGGPTAVSITVY